MTKLNENLEIGNTKYNLYDLTKRFEPVGSIIATSSIKTLRLSNLNLTPGTYMLVIQEYSTNSSGSGHKLTINNKSNYTTQCIHASGSSIDSFTRTDCLLLANGWASGTKLFFTNAFIQFFNKDWIGCEAISGTQNHLITQHGYISMQEINKIDSIELTAIDNDNIGVGSFMKLYKLN